MILGVYNDNDIDDISYDKNDKKYNQNNVYNDE